MCGILILTRVFIPRRLAMAMRLGWHYMCRMGVTCARLLSKLVRRTTLIGIGLKAISLLPLNYSLTGFMVGLWPWFPKGPGHEASPLIQGNILGQVVSVTLWFIIILALAMASGHCGFGYETAASDW